MAVRCPYRLAARRTMSSSRQKLAGQAAVLWSLHRALDWPVCEIVVVDNGSNDGSRELLTELEQAGGITLLANDRNVGHGPALNQALACLAESPRQPTHAWILDSDCVVARPDARGSLAAVLTADDREHEMYEWAANHHEPHFAGVGGAATRYADLVDRFRQEVGSPLDDANHGSVHALLRAR